MDDWDATTWAAVTTAIVAVVALFITYSQLRHTRAELQDKRLDEKVKGLIGENILLINSLTDQAKAAVDEARRGAADVEDIRTSVQQVRSQAEELTRDLAVQREEAARGRAQLEESLAAARDLREQLNRAVQQAGEDAKAISEVRSTVEEHQKLVERAVLVLAEVGYDVQTAMGLPADILAIPGPDMLNKSHLLIDVKTLEGDSPFHDALSRAAATRNMITHFSRQDSILASAAFTIVVVFDDETKEVNPKVLGPPDPSIHLVPISGFREFLSSFSTRTTR